MHILSHTKVNDLSKGLIRNFASLTLVASYICYVFSIMSQIAQTWGEDLDLTIYLLVCDRTACTRYPFCTTYSITYQSYIYIFFKCDGVQYLNLHVQAKGNNSEICQDHVDSTVIEN